ncbi:MAG: class I adenylate-forming enzyme family protein [Gammaproteobacteria bacterium]|nr:class I adenylate-forming enzyme family protein [Gammaproteobacteria bacterium]
MEPKALRLPDLLGIRAGQIPERPAHDDTRRAMTILEWHLESDKVGGGLAAAGLQPGERVLLPISNDNAVEMAIATIGVMKAGGIAVPANTRLSPQEFSEYARLIEPRFAITNVMENVAHLGIERVWPVAGMPNAIDAIPNQSQWDGGSDAMILGTSGTTGKIKGVLVKHADLTERAGDGSRFDRHGNSTLHALPFTGTGGMQGQCLMPIVLGQSSYTQPKFDPGGFLKLVEEKRPTSVFFVPTMLRLVLDHPDAASTDFSSVRYVLTGTAPLQRDSVVRTLALWPHVNFRNSYGMSEGGVGVGTTSNDMVLKPGCVGRMPRNMQVRDEAGNPLAQGEVGEIYGYQNTPRQYWRDEGASQKAWIDGWTKTGDLGYVEADGDLILTGRSKELIIRGGYNITPLEVENALHEHAAVKEAAVVGVPHEVLGEDIAAAVSLNDGHQASPEDIVGFCQERLADNKVPRTIVIMGELPKNQNAKILKRELQPMLEDAAQAARRERQARKQAASGSAGQA